MARRRPGDRGTSGGKRRKPPRQASPLEPDASGGRDSRGRFAKGNQIGVGAGAAAHREVKVRAKLQAAITCRVSPEKVDAFVDMLLTKSIDEQDLVAARILGPYILGRAAEALTAAQAHAPEHIPRAEPMDIDALADKAQAVLQAFEVGRIGEGEAKMIRELLETALKARQALDLQAQLAAIQVLLEELKEAHGA
jgi:hypothetical protein